MRKMEVREPTVITHTGNRIVFAQIADRSKWTVGRDPGSELRVTWDESVSRYHATIERLGELLVVEDSGFSTNHTMVGGKNAVGRVRLSDGDEIGLGNLTLLIRLPGASARGVTVVAGRSAKAPSNVELTERELKVVDVMIASLDGGDGRIPTNREIGEALDIGSETVKTHLKNISKKLAAQGVRGSLDRNRLAELAVQGLLGSLEREA
jgi:pSer/pThr/pTyr-binding forkhead associated (FHA) protein